MIGISFDFFFFSSFFSWAHVMATSVGWEEEEGGKEGDGGGVGCFGSSCMCSTTMVVRDTVHLNSSQVVAGETTCMF